MKNNPAGYHLEKTMRWFGPRDTVRLDEIRRTGCTGVVTSLEHIPVGELWGTGEINKRKNLIESAGMSWTVVESLPVHEDIKRQSGYYTGYIENYRQSLRNLASCGLKVVTYNFMPVFDWVRTDTDFMLRDGSRTSCFERTAFNVFDLFLLERPEASSDYSAGEIKVAEDYFNKLDPPGREKLYRNGLLALPGSSEPLKKEQVLEGIKSYSGTGKEILKKNLFYFLGEIISVAEESGIRLAIHPDDPPFSLPGLPRIVSTEQDLADILSAAPSRSNGICFCTGSLGVRADNDLPGMINRFAGHIHFVHLRNTVRYGNGNFYESGHIMGDTDMNGVIMELLAEMNRNEEPIPMRPDHGLKIPGDKSETFYPGYSLAGRVKGLAELEVLEEELSKDMS